MKKDNKKAPARRSSGGKEPFAKKEQFVILFENLSEQFTGLAEGINMKMDGFRNELKQDIKQIDRKVEDLRTSVGVIHKDLKQEIRGVGQELGDTRQDLKQEIQGVRQELGNKIDRINNVIQNHETRLVKLGK